jgi:GDP-L-fucose synthase
VDCSIKELTEIIARVTGFHGKVTWDSSKPDGAPRKLMDSSKLSGLGWNSAISLESGLINTYKHFLRDHNA